MSKAPIIVWFRQDLRLTDNPALHAAYDSGHPIIPLYILDDINAEDRKMGAASRWWLHHALGALNKDLSEHLIIQNGDATEIIPDIISKTGAAGIYWNRCYEPWRIKRDENIKSFLKDNMESIEVKSFNGSLLWEPWNIKNQAGEPYKVFTPYYRKGCLNQPAPRVPLPRPESLTYGDTDALSVSIESLDLLPTTPDWGAKMEKHWTISEDAALKRLDDFLNGGIQNYKTGRDHPADNHTSHLSPYLHFGQISPNTAWYAAKDADMTGGEEKDREHFLSELGWREFSYSLLYNFPKITWDNLQERFNDFPWNTAESGQEKQDLKAWRHGKTGYPIVDAGMRQLWATGYMHNRVRMIVGSFLVKNMLTHWHRGEEHFWDCLVDADLASNTASWQWIAGCGADAAPYFRIFNPLLQSEKFDKEGAYIREFVPELYDLPNKYIHAPWTAPEEVLEKCGVKLGETYPKPMMDHGEARDRALEAFKSTKKEEAA